jgi:hypothetical protein
MSTLNASVLSIVRKSADGHATWTATFPELLKACKGKTKTEARTFLLPFIAEVRGVPTKSGQRGETFANKKEECTATNAAAQWLTDTTNKMFATAAKASVEIEFDAKIVKAMAAVLKSLEVYAEYKVDDKAVGTAKALSLLVAEAKEANAPRL